MSHPQSTLTVAHKVALVDIKRISFRLLLQGQDLLIYVLAAVPPS